MDSIVDGPRSYGRAKARVLNPVRGQAGQRSGRLRLRRPRLRRRASVRRRRRRAAPPHELALARDHIFRLAI